MTEDRYRCRNKRKNGERGHGRGGVGCVLVEEYPRKRIRRLLSVRKDVVPKMGTTRETDFKGWRMRVESIRDVEKV